MKRAKTDTIIKALNIVAREMVAQGGAEALKPVAEDGFIIGVMREAAERLAELQARVDKRCTWVQDLDFGDVYDGSCGVKWLFEDGGPRENDTRFCPKCGGRIKLGRK